MRHALARARVALARASARAPRARASVRRVVALAPPSNPRAHAQKCFLARAALAPSRALRPTARSRAMARATSSGARARDEAEAEDEDEDGLDDEFAESFYVGETECACDVMIIDED